MMVFRCLVWVICFKVQKYKGHHYLTIFMDLEKKTVRYTTDGKDHTTVDAFVKDFEEHGGQSEKIKIVTCDMSLGFQKGITENFPPVRLYFSDRLVSSYEELFLLFELALLSIPVTCTPKFRKYEIKTSIIPPLCHVARADKFSNRTGRYFFTYSS